MIVWFVAAIGRKGRAVLVGELVDPSGISGC
jgi:hypothetical protein